MEKVLWIRSNVHAKGIDDGLEEINEHLRQGWTVKLISACAAGTAMNFGQAYAVLEKQE